jgi:dephospho-CoA kinase
MKIIGITGSSGSGKTLIADIIKEKYSVEVIKADSIVRKAQKIGMPYYKAIVKTFGQDILFSNNEIDRKKLANRIYENSEDLKKLNKLTYKYIAKDITKEINKLKKQKKLTFVVIDAPLLIESKLNKICNIIIGVISPLETKLERIISRDNLNKDEAMARLNIQPTDEFYIKNSDYIIENKEEKTSENLGEEICIILGGNLKK